VEAERRKLLGELSTARLLTYELERALHDTPKGKERDWIARIIAMEDQRAAECEDSLACVQP
jgi:hypothetical protein